MQEHKVGYQYVKAHMWWLEQNTKSELMSLFESFYQGLIQRCQDAKIQTKHKFNTFNISTKLWDLNVGDCKTVSVFMKPLDMQAFMKYNELLMLAYHTLLNANNKTDSIIQSSKLYGADYMKDITGPECKSPFKAYIVNNLVEAINYVTTADIKAIVVPKVNLCLMHNLSWTIGTDIKSAKFISDMNKGLLDTKEYLDKYLWFCNKISLRMPSGNKDIGYKYFEVLAGKSSIGISLRDILSVIQDIYNSEIGHNDIDKLLGCENPSSNDIDIIRRYQDFKVTRLIDLLNQSKCFNCLILSPRKNIMGLETN